MERMDPRDQTAQKGSLETLESLDLVEIWAPKVTREILASMENQV